MWNRFKNGERSTDNKRKLTRNRENLRILCSRILLSRRTSVAQYITWKGGCLSDIRHRTGALCPCATIHCIIHIWSTGTNLWHFPEVLVEARTYCYQDGGAGGGGCVVSDRKGRDWEGRKNNSFCCVVQRRTTHGLSNFRNYGHHRKVSWLHMRPCEYSERIEVNITYVHSV